MAEILYRYRFVAVIALLGLAAMLATQKGKLPLALRGLHRIMRKDAGGVATAPSPSQVVPVWKRILAFVLVVLAALIAMI